MRPTGHRETVPSPGVGFVLISGLGSNPDNWTRFVEQAPDRFRVEIAVKADPESDVMADKPGRPRSFAPYYQGIDDAIRALKCDSVVLVGHSLGCVLASSYTHFGKYRDRVAGQVLLSPLVIRQIESFAHPLRVGARHIGALMQALYFVLFGSAHWPERIRYSLLTKRSVRGVVFWPIDRKPRLVTQELAIGLTGPRQHSNVRSQALNAVDYRAAEWIPRPIVPTLYLEGDRDRLGSRTDRKHLERSSGYVVRMLANSGHWFHMEEPSVAWRAIEEFADAHYRSF